MNEGKNNSPEATLLRQKAEEEIKGRHLKQNSPLYQADTLKLLHELELQKIELELQNEELKLEREKVAIATVLFDFAPAGFFTLDRTGKILQLNHSGALQLMKERASLTGSDIKTYISDESLAIFEEFLNTIIQSRIKQSCEIKLLPDGFTEVYMHFEGVISEDEHKCLVTSLDITERKQAEEKLKENEEIFNQFLQNSPIYIFFKDQNIRSLRLSTNYEKMIGKPLGELLGKSMFELFPSDLAQDMVDVDLRILKEGKKVVVEEEFNGRHYSTIKFPIHLPGKPVFLAGFTIDVTEQKQAEDALRKSEEKYRKLHESLNDGYVYVSMDGLIQDSNRAFRDMLGYSEEELVKLSFFDLTPEKWHSIENDIVTNEILPNGYSSVYEKEYYKKDGTVFPVELRAFLIKDDTGNNAGMWAIVREITKRKRAQEAMREAELKFRTIFEFASDGILLAQVSNRKFTTTNGKLCKMLGYTEKELLDLEVIDIHPAGSIEHVLDQFELLATNKISFAKDIPVKRKDGSVFFADVSASRIKLNGTEHLIGMFRDVTERKQTEEALLASEKKFKSIVESSPTAMHLYRFEENDRLVLVGANPSAEEITGISHRNLIGKTIEEAFPNLIQTKIPALYKKVARGELCNQSFEIPYTNDRFSGFYNVHVFETGSNTIAVDFIDITERKNTELALLKSESHLRELNATKDKFFSIIAHDLKNPFNSILGFSDILKSIAKDLNIATVEYYAGVINASAHQTYQLLENLLSWARMQRGMISFVPRSIHLNHIVDEEFETVRNNATQKKIRLIKNVPQNLIIVADDVMLSNILRNLLSNAIKFTRKNGIIIISAQVHDDVVEISVTDNGLGMKPEAVEKLFKIETNFTMRGTEKERGTGLGLLICKEFIEKHGGKIRVESEEGTGSTFSFTIPVRQQAGENHQLPGK